MNTCPYCQANTRQVKAGLTGSGSQRYRCQHCTRRYTPEPEPHGYPEALRRQGVQMYVDGLNYRRIGRLLKVDHVTVMHWVRAQASQTPRTPPVPAQTTVIEMDELFTSIGSKRDKNRLYLVTFVERRSSCVLAWRIVYERSLDMLQTMIDSAPQARFYYSDLFAVYRQGIYTPGLYTPMPDKSETFRVEGVNAEFRHYLACLARRSRCFPRCLKRFELVLRLFIFAWNRRQLYRQRFPKYPAHLIDFVYP